MVRIIQSFVSFVYFYRLFDNILSIIKPLLGKLRIGGLLKYVIRIKYQLNIDIFTNPFASRIDTGDDNRVSKEEFCAENVKVSVEKWTGETLEDMEAEFDSIDENGGGQILFGEFVKWALDKNLDIEDDVDEAVAPE